MYMYDVYSEVIVMFYIANLHFGYCNNGTHILISINITHFILKFYQSSAPY